MKGRDQHEEILFLLTVAPISTDDQLCQWRKKTEWLYGAFLKSESLVIQVRVEGDEAVEVMDTPCFTSLYDFYD